MKSQFKKVRRKFQDSAIGNLLGLSDEGREFATWARKKEAKRLSIYYKLIGALCALFTLQVAHAAPLIPVNAPLITVGYTVFVIAVLDVQTSAVPAQNFSITRL